MDCQPIRDITDPHSVITAIDSSMTFPEFLPLRCEKYNVLIGEFASLVAKSASSANLLELIREPLIYNASQRMSLLKLFRRCVSTVCDTEATKKIRTPTQSFVINYGHTFKDIRVLKEQFENLTQAEYFALAALLGEYDSRGEQGYILTDMFFNWIESNFNGNLIIEGPRGAGPDIQLSQVFPGFTGSFPCDFVIKNQSDNRVLAIGFARYDSTRGGSQSDDRTGGNSDKVGKAIQFCEQTGNDFKIIFLSDGPGLAHRDTWEESCNLDGQWADRVRVSTLKLAPSRITYDWLVS